MFKLNHVFLFVLSFILLTSQVLASKVDPTRPFGYKAASSTPNGKKMVLESIIQGVGVSTVIISGKILKVDDYLGEYQLTAVHDNSVILQSSTERIELKIFKNNLVKERSEQ